MYLFLYLLMWLGIYPGMSMSHYLLMSCYACTCSDCAVNQDGTTALVLASKQGHTQMASMLLAAGASAGMLDKVALKANHEVNL